MHHREIARQSGHKLGYGGGGGGVGWEKARGVILRHSLLLTRTFLGLSYS